MNTLKQISRIIDLHQLIKKEITGSSTDLSKKLHIKPRMIHCYLDELRLFGASISYDRIRCTFYYTNQFDIEYHFNIIVGADNFLKKE